MGIQLYNKLYDSEGDATENMTFQQVVDRIEEMVNPPPLEIAERFKFLNRRQSPTETAAEYMMALRRISLTCHFQNDAQNPTEARLRDQFVHGLLNQDMQKFLLQEQQLTVVNVVMKATSYEAAEKTTELLNHNSSKSDANLVKSSYKAKKKTSEVKSPKCKHCGYSNHLSEKCKFKDATCYRCQQVGHTARMCSDRSGNKQKARLNSKVSSAKEIEEEAESSEESSQSNYVCTVNSFEGTAKYLIDLTCNGYKLTLEFDTGSGETILNKEDWRKINSPELQPTKMNFRSFSGHLLASLGSAEMTVEFAGRKYDKMRFYVVDGTKISLLGRRWIDKMNLNCKHCRRKKMAKEKGIALMSAKMQNAKEPGQDVIKPLLKEYADLFDGTLGCIKGFKAKVTLSSEVQLRKFWQARPVPFVLEKAVELEVDRLEKRGIMERIHDDISEYASPIVVVAKRGNTKTVRICGDFKVSINKVIKVEQYPLPTAEQLFTRFGGCEVFTKLDLTEAYHQVEIDKESQKYLVINTKKGLYRYKRLPFGISSAPAMFQKYMDQVLRGLDGVGSFMDDITVGGKDEVEHAQRLRAVFQRLRDFGVRLGLEKCSFGAKSIVYLGHIIDGQGLHTMPDKIQAIMEAPAPKNVGELRSFLGLVNYYGKFIKNLSSLCTSLYDLLHKDVIWNWEKRQQVAFTVLKKIISTPPVLCHYNPDWEIGLATDASAYGVGAVLFHILPDGTEKPISFASQTLNSAQKNYAQIEKEAYSIVFGVTRFRQYLYGRKFTLVTDHKPLLALFGADKPIPDRTSSRIQRWALILMGYSYELKFKSTAKHGNADGLSRLPLERTTDEDVFDITDIFDIDDMAFNNLSSKRLQDETVKDKLLSKVVRYVNGNWPARTSLHTDVPAELDSFHRQREELSVENGCLFWKQRVILPSSLRKEVLAELHQGHLGVTKMKGLARMMIWWPNMDEEIERISRKCKMCESVRPEAPAAPVHPWEFPEKPWHRLHIDYAGPKHGHYWLIVMDVRTKWPEVIPMKSTTGSATVNAMLQMISRFGIPAQIVSDNGPQFTGEEFKQFCRRFGITHIRTSPYHPRSNGEAERFVRTIKAVMGKETISFEHLMYRIHRFLLAYRNSPHATTGIAPSELLMGRRCRLPLDALQAKPEDKVCISQNRQASSKKKVRKFFNGDTVWAREYCSKNTKWAAGVIMHQLAPLTYKVQVGNKLWKRHIDQLIERNPECNARIENPVRRQNNLPDLFVQQDLKFVPDDQQEPATVPEVQMEIPPEEPTVIPHVRRSSRQGQKPKRLLEEI